MRHSEHKKEIGARIAQLRKQKGLNQAGLAKRLEVTRERLGKWERGVCSLSLEDLAALSEVLGVQPEELGFGPRQPPLPPSQLRELVQHLNAMARLLRPWMEGLKGMK